MIQLGGGEILFLSAIIAGVCGIYFRNKEKTKPFIGFLVGSLGGVIVSFLLCQTLFASIFIIPVYSVLGSWLFNLALSKIKK